MKLKEWVMMQKKGIVESMHDEGGFLNLDANAVAVIDDYIYVNFGNREVSSVYEDVSVSKVAKLLKLKYNKYWEELNNTLDSLNDLKESSTIDITENVNSKNDTTTAGVSVNREHANNDNAYIETDSNKIDNNSNSEDDRTKVYEERRTSTTLLQRNINFITNHNLIDEIAKTIVNDITVLIY